MSEFEYDSKYTIEMIESDLDMLHEDINDYLHPFVHGDEDTTVDLGGKPTDSLRRMVHGIVTVQNALTEEAKQAAKEAADSAESAAREADRAEDAADRAEVAAAGVQDAVDAAEGLSESLGWLPWGLAISSCRLARSAIAQAIKIYKLQTA